MTLVEVQLQEVPTCEIPGCWTPAWIVHRIPSHRPPAFSYTVCLCRKHQNTPDYDSFQDATGVIHRRKVTR